MNVSDHGEGDMTFWDFAVVLLLLYYRKEIGAIIYGFLSTFSDDWKCERREK